MSAKEQAIDTLTSVAKGLGHETKLSTASVLQVTLTDTVSFGVLNVFNQSCAEVSSRTNVPIETMLVSQGKQLVIATRVGAKRPRGADDEDAPSQRDLDEVQTKVEDLVKKVNKAASKDSINDSEMQIAKKVLQKCTALLLGPSGVHEKAVQSFGLFQKKLAPSDPRPRLVIALRLNAGVPIDCKVLKSCLGSCWTDGAITISDSVSGVDSVQLPLTPEGEASREHGNMPILIVTSVPIEGRASAQ
jgi:hypothetical protein